MLCFKAGHCPLADTGREECSRDKSFRLKSCQPVRPHVIFGCAVSWRPVGIACQGQLEPDRRDLKSRIDLAATIIERGGIEAGSGPNQGTSREAREKRVQFSCDGGEPDGRQMESVLHCPFHALMREPCSSPRRATLCGLCPPETWKALVGRLGFWANNYPSLVAGAAKY